MATAPQLAAKRPILESGDHLTQPEFHRLYDARPDLGKVELVEGIVYVASPTRTDVHGDQHGYLAMWMSMYVSMHLDAIRVSPEVTLIIDEFNEVQPDLVLRRLHSGRGWLDDDGYMHGAPELIVEVAASSASIDARLKKDVYRRAGVQEYIVWRVLDGAVDWWRLVDGEYIPMEPDSDGVLESAEFAGLRLDVPKLLDGDMAGVLERLRA